MTRFTHDFHRRKYLSGLCTSYLYDWFSIKIFSFSGICCSGSPYMGRQFLENETRMEFHGRYERIRLACNYLCCTKLTGPSVIPESWFFDSHNAQSDQAGFYSFFHVLNSWVCILRGHLCLLKNRFMSYILRVYRHNFASPLHWMLKLWWHMRSCLSVQSEAVETTDRSSYAIARRSNFIKPQPEVIEIQCSCIWAFFHTRCDSRSGCVCPLRPCLNSVSVGSSGMKWIDC